MNRAGTPPRRKAVKINRTPKAAHDDVKDSCAKEKTNQIIRSGPPAARNQIVIPWKAMIITPTASQLLQYEACLNDISKALGSRSPEDKEKNLKDIRIPWEGRALKPTPG